MPEDESNPDLDPDLDPPDPDLDDQMSSPPIPVSENLPLEDTQSYTDLIKKIVVRLGLSTAVPTPSVEDVIFDVL